eukprot:101496_1
MGTCIGSELEKDLEKHCDKEITQKLLEHQQLQTDKRLIQILICGVQQSGISTICKQLKFIYDDEMNYIQKTEYIGHIHKQCVDQMKLLINVLQRYDYDIQTSKQTMKSIIDFNKK